MNEDIVSGDIIQITDVLHPWFTALLIVDEVSNWGVVAYVVVPKSNKGDEPPSLAYNRLQWEMFVKVGEAAVVQHEIEDGA